MEFTMHGVKGTITDTNRTKITDPQVFKTEWREYGEGAQKMRVRAEVRFDDSCKNGHQSFAITGTTHYADGGYWREDSCGCIHGEIAQHFPELAHLIRWHLVDTDGPMHYVANTTYLAGDRDHNGLLKGETRQIVNGRTGLPSWHLVAFDALGKEIPLYELPKYADGAEPPELAHRLAWKPWGKLGEGKMRELDAARRTACWPDATDEQLSLPREELTKLLEARLPALLVEFKAAMAAAGLEWRVQ
jgi:hypothetical protein